MIMKVELFSEWQCGSGLAGGADVDVLAIKDKDGFPFIPGKTLKGLLADAATQLALFDTEHNEAWEHFKTVCFGKQNEGKDKSTESGCMFVSNAVLSQPTKDGIAKNVGFLFRKRSGTAIDDNGQATEHTLRRIEVAVPMTLYATIDGCPEEFREHLVKCLKWVKLLGTQRNRGMGRCRMSEVQA